MNLQGLNDRFWLGAEVLILPLEVPFCELSESKSVSNIKLKAASFELSFFK
jgi:hypothetical protein